MSLTMYAIFSLFGLISFNVLAAPMLELHSIHKRELKSDVPEPEDNARVQTFTEGHTLELNCDASGPAPPVIHWLKNGVYVEQGPLDHFAENLIVPNPVGGENDNSHFTMSNLVIKSATLADAGRYTCVADTESSRVTNSFQVRITPSAESNAQPNKRHLSHDVRIYLWTESVLEEQDTESRFICRATQGPNKPAPQIRWEIDDSVVTDDNSESLGVRVHSNGDLEFIATVHLNMAYIKCIAIGIQGDEDVKEPFLYVLEPSDASGETLSLA